MVAGACCGCPRPSVLPVAGQEFRVAPAGSLAARQRALCPRAQRGWSFATREASTRSRPGLHAPRVHRHADDRRASIAPATARASMPTGDVTAGPGAEALRWLEVSRAGGGPDRGSDEGGDGPRRDEGAGMSHAIRHRARSASFSATCAGAAQLPRIRCVRRGAPTTDRARSQFVFGNVFLHLHPARIHRWSLRWTTTLGLGIAVVGRFVITLVTGMLLMFYYKPSLGRGLRVDQGHPLRRAHRAVHAQRPPLGGATCMVLAVLLHMARVFYTAPTASRASSTG